jgi:opacity protein-like surface antigen
MTRFFFCFLLAGLVFCSYGVRGQSLNRRFSVGFGLEAGLPEGDVKDIYSFTGGLTIRFSYRVGHGFVTFTTGGIGYAPFTDDINLRAAVQIPAKAGYKYIIGRHLFIMGELGYSDFRSYYKDISGKLQSADNGGFTYAPTIGVQFGVIEIGLRYETVQAGGLNVAHEGVRLGFNF